jgi:hypothetical protein
LDEDIDVGVFVRVVIVRADEKLAADEIFAGIGAHLLHLVADLPQDGENLFFRARLLRNGQGDGQPEQNQADSDRQAVRLRPNLERSEALRFHVPARSII